MQQLVLDFTRPGQLVCDPYAGGGTTLIAAKTLGRTYLGWEISEEAVKLGHKALRQTKEQLNIERLLTPVKPSGRRNTSPQPKAEQLGLGIEDS
jgi:site-specific DNA-methyltransferase (adenine-specific)